MFIKDLKDCKEIIAGDKTILREVLHPKNDNINLRYSLAYAKINIREASLPHRLKSTEVYYILKGQGIMYINEESIEVGEGCTIYIPTNAVQYIRNIGNKALEFLCIVDPAWRPEDEIEIE